MCQRTLDVEQRKAIIEVHGRGVSFYQLRNRFIETTRPGLFVLHACHVLSRMLSSYGECMPEKRSINQNIRHNLLPDFRNLGTVLRIVLLVNGIALFAGLTQASSFSDLLHQWMYGSALLQPILLSSLLLLYAGNSALARTRYWQSASIITFVVVLDTLALAALGGELFADPADPGNFRFWRQAIESGIVTLFLLSYFRWRALALSPAKQEARLQALQARIRPHFLFNSINAVLGIVRAEPKRAERALEDMSDLFRMAMSETHELVELVKEVEWTRQYLALEQLRLGDRLQVQWNTEDMPSDALIPPLVLQPLLENAVYHGIEPMVEGGVIEVRIYREGKELHLEVRNPVSASAPINANGNKMALPNILERLSLLFDVEADYRVEQSTDHYQVYIVIPYVKEATH
jgi:two-component system sensor histidine kinase AlgZ